MIKILTREYLATYAFLAAEIERMRKRIKYYEDHPLQKTYGVVRGSLNQFPFTECHFVVSGPTVKSSEERDKSIRQLVIDLKGNEQLLQDMKLDIEIYLETLPPEHLEIKHILALKYVEGKKDGEIANIIKCDRSTVSKKIDRFLSSLLCA